MYNRYIIRVNLSFIIIVVLGREGGSVLCVVVCITCELYIPSASLLDSTYPFLLFSSFLSCNIFFLFLFITTKCSFCGFENRVWWWYYKSCLLLYHIGAYCIVILYKVSFVICNTQEDTIHFS